MHSKTFWSYETRQVYAIIVMHIPVKGAVTVVGIGANDKARAADKNNKQVIFKNCVPFTDCITEYIEKVDNAKDLDVAMSMFNLIKYSNNYSKTSGSLIIIIII